MPEIPKTQSLPVSIGPRPLWRRLSAGELRTAELLLVAALFLLSVAALHALCLSVYPKAELDPWNLSDFYPMSVFKLRRPLAYQAGLSIATFVAFAWIWPHLSKPHPKLVTVFLAGLGFVFLGNLLHGYRYGIDYPTASSGTGIEYYDDAVLIHGALWFLGRFNEIQFELLEHARTHPPGPVLLYYALVETLRVPGLISVAIAALSLGLGLPYLRRLLELIFIQEPPGSLLLYSILPGMLVYGIAVVDALIASLFLATLVEFLDEQRRGSTLGASFFLALSLFFTFGALFLLPVLVGFELVRRRRVTRSLALIGVAALFLAALAPLTGFDWLASFLQASAIENEKGFLLLANPRGYLWYRLGALAEISIFFTPFMLLLALRGWNTLRRSSADGHALGWIGLASLGLLLLSGAMKIGEAARICLFILPYLLLPALAAFRELGEASRRATAHAVFAWGLVLQLFGFYQW